MAMILSRNSNSCEWISPMAAAVWYSVDAARHPPTSQIQWWVIIYLIIHSSRASLCNWLIIPSRLDQYQVCEERYSVTADRGPWPVNQWERTSSLLCKADQSNVWLIYNHENLGLNPDHGGLLLENGFLTDFPRLPCQNLQQISNFGNLRKQQYRP